MTYVSRRTRITGSRWLDENLKLSLARKRSNARLKRHSSSDDLRAWVNDSYMNYEHLLDLMSDGELVSNFQLYGRFIPVPVLVDILKNAEKTSAPVEGPIRGKRRLRLNSKVMKQASEPDLKNAVGIEENAGEAYREKEAELMSENDSPDENEVTGEPDSTDEEDTNSEITLDNVMREKEIMEDLLNESLKLLKEALEKLEKIDGIVNLAQGDIENSRNEDIEDPSLLKRKSSVADSVNSENLENSDAFSSKSYIKKVKDSVKCRDLLRKISGFRYKLKKIQDRRQDINQKILMSQQRMCRNSPSLQVTELYNRKEATETKRALVKRLQRNMEKLIAEKGRLLSEMCQALNSLNSLKKSSKCSVSSQRKSSKALDELKCDDLNCYCFCNCQMSDNNFESSETDKMFNSQSSMDSLNEGVNKSKMNYKVQPHAHRTYVPTSFLKKRSSAKSEIEERRPYVSVEFSSSVNDTEGSETTGKNISVECLISHHDSTRTVNLRAKDKSPNMKKSQRRLNSASAPGFYKQGSKNPQLKIHCVTEEEVGGNKELNKSRVIKKSRLKFICPDPKRQAPYGSMVNFQVRISSDDISISQDEPASLRPSTSPTTKREKYLKAYRQRSSRNLIEDVPQRKVKSETTMQEVEKALRNYEERLKRLDCLENKVEALRQKLAELMHRKKVLAKQIDEVKKVRALEAERSAREIMRLCSENWDLKKQVEQMSGEFEMQNRRIQSLKMGTRKTRELEVETEVLKKELSGYRDTYEEQQKCIARLHSVVDVQRTEIENLMDHIRKLTMMHQAPPYNAPHPEKKSPQKSRSLSPESGKSRRVLRTKTQPVRQPVKSSDEEQVRTEFCFCHVNPQRGTRPKNSLGNSMFFGTR